MKEGQQSAAPKPPNLSEAPASILGRLAGIWRYPVMGLQGEMLREAEISRQGVVGDHVYVVRDRRTGSILDPKSYAYSWGETSAMLRLIEIKAELLVRANGADEVRLTLPDGKVRSSDTGELGQALSKALSRQVEVVKYPRIVESRVLSGRTLHLLTTASLASMKGFYPSGDFDLRRFRPNILVESGLGEGFVEEGWLSCTVTVGDGVRLKVEKPNLRCVVTTLRQGGLKEDTWILDSIEKHNQKKLGVMCSVSVGGVVRIGDGIGLV